MIINILFKSIFRGIRYFIIYILWFGFMLAGWVNILLFFMGNNRFPFYSPFWNAFWGIIWLLNLAIVFGIKSKEIRTLKSIVKEKIYLKLGI